MRPVPRHRIALNLRDGPSVFHLASFCSEMLRDARNGGSVETAMPRKVNRRVRRSRPLEQLRPRSGMPAVLSMMRVATNVWCTFPSPDTKGSKRGIQHLHRMASRPEKPPIILVSEREWFGFRGDVPHQILQGPLPSVECPGVAPPSEARTISHRHTGLLPSGGLTPSIVRRSSPRRAHIAI